MDQIHGEQRLPPSRGAIVDRDGRELALTVRSASVYAFPSLMKDRDRDRPHRRRHPRPRPRPRSRSDSLEHEGFTYLARWVDPAKAEKLRALELEGDRHRSRAAPQLSGRQARRGADRLREHRRQGRPRRRADRGRVADAASRARSRSSATRGAARSPSTPAIRATVEGGEIALTLDAAMQGAAEAALADTIAERGAKGGIVLTLDPKNGDVLALAEAPGLRPEPLPRARLPRHPRPRPSATSSRRARR